jgi:bifunctional non-homologous end joining protein LigD
VSPSGQDKTLAQVDGRQLALSNLGKVMYPSTGFTKGGLLDYYSRVAGVLLPHLKARPVTLRRFPDGVRGFSFFEKHLPSHAPDWVKSITVPALSTGRGSARGGEVDYPAIDGRPALIWAVNLAAIEFHVPLWHDRRGELPSKPDHLVFDLDPGPGTSIVECCRVAGWISAELGHRGTGPVAKTSGSKGLQVYQRLGGRSGWDAIHARALKIAEAVRDDHPELVVTNMKKELRQGKVLIDWSQNNAAKTTVAVYSLRGGPRPSVSTPVTWEEVASCDSSGDPGELHFGPGEVLDRISRMGDLFDVLL